MYGSGFYRAGQVNQHSQAAVDTTSKPIRPKIATVGRRRWADVMEEDSDKGEVTGDLFAMQAEEDDVRVEGQNSSNSTVRGPAE